MLRAAFYRPGAPYTNPYARAIAPVGPVPERTIVILGGSLTVLRGGFPDQGSLTLSRPVLFRAKDWVRIWLPGDAEEDPTYTGECLGESWPRGQGEVALQGIWESFKQCRWVGAAKGDFPTFFAGVLSHSDLPSWLPVLPLPAITSVFSADTPSELLGDTVSAITPALDGHLIGVTAAPALACVDPGQMVLHRFFADLSERPPGSTRNYANCVRFSFEYPSGDVGYFEGSNKAELAAVNGLRQWEVVQVTAREVGLPEEPYENVTGHLIRTATPGGLAGLRADETLLGRVFFDLDAADLAAPQITTVPDMTTWPGGAGDQSARARAETEASLRGTITFQQGFWQAALNSFESNVNSSNWYTNGVLVVNVGVTSLNSVSMQDTLRWGQVDAAGNVTWLAKAGSAATGYNHIWTLSGNWTPAPEAGALAQLLIDPNHLGDATNSSPATFVLGYEPAFLATAAAAGVAVKPITWHGGGRLSMFPDLTSNAFLKNDLTVIQPRLLLDGTPIMPSIPFALFNGAFQAEYNPVSHLNDTPVMQGTVLISPNATLSLPYGSSVEVEMQSGGLISDAWVVHELDEAAVTAELGGAGGRPAAVMTALLKAVPGPYTRLVKVADTPDGWARFAVRYPDSWNGAGDPPGPMTLKHLLLGGATQIGRVRLKTPNLGNLTEYGARLLRYRASPMRDWRGFYRTLKRAPALGVAAFEVPGQTDDELLDVQRVTYDLTPQTTRPVTVQAGSPLPVDDVDAVGVVVDGIRRTIRRAGGTT